jgi:hypothetical protein
MILLLAHPFPSLHSSSYLSFSVFLFSLVTDGKEWEGREIRPARKPGTLKSFNALCQLLTSNHHGVFFPYVYKVLRDKYFMFKILSVGIFKEHETAILSQETETIQEAVNESRI